ncbi:MAG: 2-oxoglutarate and iron-dependent oxygenase domain-containing protein [Actinomycetota bacterium]|nr:2-oxoglutarate and iron-dependent oxygenase domain-containing protein [Actinomycetota bacterium]
MSEVVPTIDLSPWAEGGPQARRRLAADIDRACTEIGFLHLVGHGIADDVIAAQRAAADHLFGLPLEEKLALMSPSAEVNRGYAAEGTESLAYSLGQDATPDRFEAFNLGPDAPDLDNPAVVAARGTHFAPNIWPDAHPDVRDAFVRYFAEARRVADLLTEIFAAALDLEPGFFGRHTGHSTDTLRVIHYERRDDAPPIAPGQMRMGAHTDYGIVTVLLADPVPGLQVHTGGDWHDVVPDPGALLANLGDLTAQWTNDRWRSTLHRVVPPPEGTTGPFLRRSAAFFHDGDHDALVECLPTCQSEDNPARYPPVLAGEHLMAKLLGPRELRPSTATQTTGDRLTT